jgi:hypothetical protein
MEIVLAAAAAGVSGFGGVGEACDHVSSTADVTEPVDDQPREYV